MLAVSCFPVNRLSFPSPYALICSLWRSERFKIAFFITSNPPSSLILLVLKVHLIIYKNLHLSSRSSAWPVRLVRLIKTSQLSPKGGSLRSYFRDFQVSPSSRAQIDSSKSILVLRIPVIGVASCTIPVTLMLHNKDRIRFSKHIENFSIQNKSNWKILLAPLLVLDQVWVQLQLVL